MPEWAATLIVTIVTLTGGGIVKLLWSINAKLSVLQTTVSDHDRTLGAIKRTVWPASYRPQKEPL